MKFKVDHDLHIHSKISLCSNDPGQTNEHILEYAEKNGFETICLTDHFWDETVEGASDWYAKQDFAHISAALPLPQSENVQFLFGVETEFNKALTVGVSKERMDSFDFIIIPTTHFHMRNYTITEEDAASVESRVQAWIRRFDALMNMDLPFHKIGIAHLGCSLIAPTREEYLQVLDAIPESEMVRLFTKAAQIGLGIELNGANVGYGRPEKEAESILRMFHIAKKCGCKFYFGSDAHHPHELTHMKEAFEWTVEKLGLEESDKIDFLKQMRAK